MSPVDPKLQEFYFFMRYKKTKIYQCLICENWFKTPEKICPVCQTPMNLSNSESLDFWESAEKPDYYR